MVDASHGCVVVLISAVMHELACKVVVRFLPEN